MPSRQQLDRETPAQRERRLAKRADWQRRDLYGITPEAWVWMLEQQGGACATCDADAVVVDHDHTDGHVRALLCVGCNTHLGKMEADAARHARLVNYARTA